LQPTVSFRQDGAAWLCVHLLISISQTDGLAVLVPSLGRPDHRISHPVIFSYGRYVKECIEILWPTSTIWRTELQLILQQLMLTCYSVHGWSFNASGHCTCYKPCSYWMLVVFRTNFESFSSRLRSSSMSVSFHKGFIHE
jgi:hypothetical protein